MSESQTERKRERERARAHAKERVGAKQSVNESAAIERERKKESKRTCACFLFVRTRARCSVLQCVAVFCSDMNLSVYGSVLKCAVSVEVFRNIYAKFGSMLEYVACVALCRM